MTGRTIHGSYRTVSASKLVEAVASSLTDIKHDDELTDAELGGFLGKGEDQGAKYRTALAEMPMTSFLRGCERWNGRFADTVLSLIGMKLCPLDAATDVGRESATAVTKLLLQLSIALEDGRITDEELVSMRRELDEAGRAIDAMRQRLGPKATQA